VGIWFLGCADSDAIASSTSTESFAAFVNVKLTAFLASVGCTRCRSGRMIAEVIGTPLNWRGLTSTVTSVWKSEEKLHHEKPW
jgi:hypothetical protein